MIHKYIHENDFLAVGTALKEDLLSLHKTVSLDEFKQTFHKFGIVVDNGQYEIFNNYHKIGMFPNMVDSMVLTAIAVSDSHYADLNHPPELLSFQPITDGSCSSVLKEEIFKRLEAYQVDYKDIKKIPKSSVMGKMKDSMFVDAYEAVQKDISKLFNKHGVTTDYEVNKGIIKGSKNIDQLPIQTSVYVNRLISRRIEEGLRLEGEILQKNSKFKDKPNDNPDKYKGIFIA